MITCYSCCSSYIKCGGSSIYCLQLLTDCTFYDTVSERKNKFKCKYKIHEITSSATKLKDGGRWWKKKSSRDFYKKKTDESTIKIMQKFTHA